MGCTAVSSFTSLRNVHVPCGILRCVPLGDVLFRLPIFLSFFTRFPSDGAMLLPPSRNAIDSTIPGDDWGNGTNKTGKMEKLGVRVIITCRPLPPPPARFPYGVPPTLFKNHAHTPHTFLLLPYLLPPPQVQCANGTTPCHPGQSVFWFSQGCTPGCDKCDHNGKRWREKRRGSSIADISRALINYTVCAT